MNNKKKLLIVNGSQFGHSSGHFFYSKFLINDFTLGYICYDRGLDRMVLEGVNVNYVSFSGNKLVRVFRFIKECIKQSYFVKPDILFVTYFNLCFLLKLFCKYEKSVLDIRSGSLNKSRIFRGFENYFLLLQSLLFPRVVILSDSLRKKLYISRKKCNVVPLGSEIYFSGNHDFKTLDLLYVGSLDERNITKTILGLHLFRQLNESKSIDIHYTIIGFGSQAEILKILNSISAYNMVNIVKYEGRKNHEELAKYFMSANIGVAFVPQTPWYDCQPVTKLFEYMLSGMPVIATNTYENRLKVNIKNGVLINDTPEDFCNGLREIYLQRDSFDSFEIRKSAETNTWENIVNKNLNPYLKKLLI
jgi:glycosyltransferase involved in cell wall biosynthesis